MTRFGPPIILCSIVASAFRPGAVVPQRIPRENPLMTAAPTTGIIAVEGERMLWSSDATAGGVSRQDMRPFGAGWSGDAQLFWGPTSPGAQLSFSFKTASVGRYEVFVDFTRAPDYAVVRATFDGAPIVTFNGYAPRVTRDRALLGMLDLEPGVHELLLEATAKDGKSTGFRVGIDRLTLEPVGHRPPGA